MLATGLQDLRWKPMMARTAAKNRLLPASASASAPGPGPAAIRAAVSPSALVLAGAGAAVGLVAGLPIVVAVAIGAGFWGVRVGAGAALAAARRQRARRPEVIDPYAVPDPWRSFVRESLTAQAKFDQAVARSHPGPLRDRLGAVSVRVQDGVRECWRVAHLGAALDAALAALDPEATSAEMRRFQATAAGAGSGAGSGAGAGAGTGAGVRGATGAGGVGSDTSSLEAARARDETEAAMAAQLQAARRVEAAARRATDRLRVLTAEMNAAVAGAVELSLDAADAAAARELAGQVDTVVGEIEALRQALEESNGTGRPTTGPGTSSA